MRNIKVRIIKSEHCDTCKSYLPRLQKLGYAFEVYDGDAVDHQKQLDEWKITEFPVVQILSITESGEAEVEHQFQQGKSWRIQDIDFMKDKIRRKYLPKEQ